MPGYGKLPVTLIDCANPVVIFKAEDAAVLTVIGTEIYECTNGICCPVSKM